MAVDANTNYAKVGHTRAQGGITRLTFNFCEPLHITMAKASESYACNAFDAAFVKLLWLLVHWNIPYNDLKFKCGEHEYCISFMYNKKITKLSQKKQQWRAAPHQKQHVVLV